MGFVWAYQTRIGTFYVVQRPNGRFSAMYEDEDLGSYHSPDAAADDLSGGHTFSISNGIDTATCGIPDSVSEWQRIK